MKRRGDHRARANQPLITKVGRRRKQPIPRIWARRSTSDLAREKVIAAAEEDFRPSVEDITDRINQTLRTSLDGHVGQKMSGPLTLDSVRRTALESLRKQKGYKTLRLEDVTVEQDPDDPCKVNIKFPQPVLEFIGIDFSYSTDSKVEEK